MDFDVRRLDLENRGIFQRALVLQQRAFPNSTDLDTQLLHNSLGAPKGTIFIGAFDHDRLIGITGFVRHSAVFRERKLAAFQICSVATDPDCQGRGVFSAIIGHAQRTLLDNDSFLFGFPNERARPIYVGKLGFGEAPLVKVLVPRFFARRLADALRRADDCNAISFDQIELAEWKRSLGGRKVETFALSDIQLWGFYYKIRLLGAGTVSIGGVFPAGSSRNEMPARHTNALFYSLVASTGGSLAGALRYMPRKPYGTMIFYPKKIARQDVRFELTGGLPDFF